MKKIHIGCDHGGYEIKCKVIEHFANQGYEFEDVGCHSTEITKFTEYCMKVSQAVSSGAADRGILICSTGIGMSIFANKHKGVRASMCTSTYMAKMTRRHNDSNILCLGGKISGEYEIYDMIDVWLNSEFDGGRHEVAWNIVKEEENNLLK